MDTEWINKWISARSWLKKPSHLFLNLIFGTPYLLPVSGTRNTESYLQALIMLCPVHGMPLKSHPWESFPNCSHLPNRY